MGWYRALAVGFLARLVTLTALDLDPAQLRADDVRLTREIGKAAHQHRFQAIQTASATGVDDVVAVLTNNLAGAVLDATLVQQWHTPDDLR